MSTQSTDMRGKAIRETIARRAGVPQDADAIAQSTLDTWQQIAAQLEPVIGLRGVDALFNRSLQRACNTFHWLEMIGVRGNGAASLAHLGTCFKGREPAVATDAACALIGTFTELLANLLGESLTARLVDVVWLPSTSETQKQPPSCVTN